MADVVSTLRGWSATESSNSPSGGTTIGTGLDDNLRTVQAVVRKYLASVATPMASASTVNLATADGWVISITGTTTITALGTEPAGISYLLVFADVLTLTNNNSSLILPGNANITTQVGDCALVVSLGSGNWGCYNYHRMKVPPARFLESFSTPIASATTTNLATATGYFISITGTTQIEAFGTEPAGVNHVLIFADALVLKYNATSMILPGYADITTVANDTALMVSLGNGNWGCYNYQRTSVAP